MAIKRGSIFVFVSLLYMGGCVLPGAHYPETAEQIFKQPVPWPEGVEVNGLHRNIGMADSLPPETGRYLAVQEGDPFYAPPGQLEGRHGADIIVKEDDLYILGIRPVYYNNDERLIERTANWYSSRFYKDTASTNARGPFSYWQLEAHYYTGRRDMVSHDVPANCLAEGGASVLGEDSVIFHAPSARERWNGDLVFQRVTYARQAPDGEEVYGVVYYLFGFNDKPIDEKLPSRASLDVHRQMSSQDVFHYYVKVQFSPLMPPTGLSRQEYIDQADQAAQEFVASFMPTLLAQFPLLETLTELEEAEQAEDD